MAVNQEITYTFNAKTGELIKQTKKLEESMEGVADAAQDAADSTEDIGKQAKKSGGLLKKAGKLAADGFKLVGTAIAATGLLGLVTKVLQPIIKAFLENKKVADTLKLAMAGVGAVIETIVSLAEPLVDFLVNAFKNPQGAVDTLKEKMTALGDYIGTLIDTALNPLQRGLLNMKRGFLEAATATIEFFKGDATELKKQIREVDDQLSDLVKEQEENKEALAEPFVNAADAVSEWAEETKKAVAAATELEKAMIALDDRQRDLNVRTAQTAAEVEELKRQRDDERLSIEERIAAAEAAAEIDQRLADENVAIAEERARLLAQEIELQGETEERLNALAEAEIAAANARGASAAVQTELMASIYDLNQELIAQEAEKAQAAREAAEEILAAQQELEDELYALTLTAQEREELAAMQEYDRRVAMAGDDEGLIKAATEQLNADLAEIQEKADKEAAHKDKANAEAIAAARLSVAKSSLDALSALNEAFAGDSEEEQKRGFERSKKIQTAQALISTYESAVQAFKSLAGIPVVGPALGGAAAAAAVVAGLANVKKIQSQTFQGGSAAGGGDTYQGAGTAPTAGATTIQPPALDLGFLGAGAGQQGPIRAYVLAENVSTAQQANQKIQDQATL